MKVVEVIPISRSIRRDNLSYFTAKEVAPGAIVSVPVNNKLVDALVTETRQVGEAKADIKIAEYELKKIDRVKCRRLFLPTFIQAMKQTADYFAGRQSQTLKQLVPRIILDNCASLRLPSLKDPPAADQSTPKPSADKPAVLQEEEGERLSVYKGLIREAFSRGKSVFLCTPTLSDLNRIAATLERGIEDYTVRLHPNLSKKTVIDAWNKAVAGPHPVLIIGTPLFLFLPRPDLKVVILDRENAGAYKMLARPFIDLRQFAEILTKLSGARLILADNFLRTETIFRQEKDELLPALPLKQRSAGPPEQTLVAVHKDEVLSEELKTAIRLARESNERILLLANRRGLAPVILCGDCGYPVVCRECGAPVVLHQASKEGLPEATVLICHKCGTVRDSRERCAHCQSWRLQALGIGVEKVAASLRSAFPDINLFQMDSDRIKNHKQAEEMVKKFLNSPGGLLLGTEMMLHYLKEKAENGFVVSVDPLLAVPDFRMNEKIFNLLLRLRSLSAKRFIVQTRYPNLPLFDLLLQGRLLDFYREEIAERRTFGYPPFRLFIKISLEGRKDRVVAEMAELKKLLAGREPISFKSFTQPKNKYRLHLVLKVLREEWPEPSLLQILKNLPPNFTTTVDPDTIL